MAKTKQGGDAPPEKPAKLKRSVYESELERLQLELVKLQEYVKAEGQRVVVVFEGRDAAGKGGVIKTCLLYTSPSPRDRS